MNVSSTDFGTYTCVSTNIVGKDSGSIRLYGKLTKFDGLFVLK